MLTVVSLILCVLPGAGLAEEKKKGKESGFKHIFDGKSLKGWEEMPKVEQQVAEAKALVSLLPSVDDNEAEEQYQRVSVARMMQGFPYVEAPSWMRVKTFGTYKRVLCIKAEALEELQRYAEAQPIYEELCAFAVAEEAAV